MKYWPEEITDEEAIKTIVDYPDQDGFVNRHLQQWLHNGEYCDNSIEMASLWTYCKQVYDDQEFADGPPRICKSCEKTYYSNNDYCSLECKDAYERPE